VIIHGLFGSKKNNRSVSKSVHALQTVDSRLTATQCARSRSRAPSLRD